MDEPVKHTLSFSKDVLQLGVHKIDDYYEIYMAIMPFINEILSLLTITIFLPLLGLELYPHFPKNFNQLVVHAIVNVLAITGIVANAAHYGEEYARHVGLVKGTLYAFFTFFIPNLFLYNMLRPIKNNGLKLILGLVIIYLLDVTVHSLSYFYIHHFVKDDKKRFVGIHRSP